MADSVIAQGPTHAHRLLNAFHLFGGRTAFRWKENNRWNGITYADFGAKAKSLAAFLQSRGVKRGDRVAVWFETSWEWVAADCAVQLLGAVTIPIYHSLSISEATYILKDCGATALFAGYQHLLDLESEMDSKLLKITMDGDAGLGIREAISNGEKILKKDAALGKKIEAPDVTSDDLSAIIYTSGTTGVPKGAVLTHRNVAGSNLDSLIGNFLGGSGDVLLLHLPMAHIMARNVSVPAILYCGGTLAIAEPQRERLPENLLETQPTAFVTVPYLLDKFMAGVLDKIRSQAGLKKWLSEYAISTGRKKYLASIATGAYRKPTLGPIFKMLDRMVLRKIRAALGGNLRLIIIGGANSNRESVEFFWGIGIPIYEGYGATELTNVATYTSPASIKLGSVGKPCPGVEVKLADDGEVYVRGPNVMKAYWNQKEATQESIDADGWYHTGDIGAMDKDGFLQIVDRKKEIYALSTGKNVAPQGVENTLKRSSLIMQVFVAGDRRRYVSALIVPDTKAIQKILGLASAPDMQDFRLNEIIQKEIERVSVKLSEYERVKKFSLIGDPFSVENGMLTPTLKLRRKVIQQKYASEIDAMYEIQSTWVFPPAVGRA